MRVSLSFIDEALPAGEWRPEIIERGRIGTDDAKDALRALGIADEAAAACPPAWRSSSASASVPKGHPPPDLRAEARNDRASAQRVDPR